MLINFYKRYIFKYPKAITALLLTLLLAFSFYASKLEIDASADTLLLDDDKDLQFSRTIDQRFNTEKLMVITYRPNKDLLSEESLETINTIHENLRGISIIDSIDSILTVPLLMSPIQEIQDLVGGTKSLKEDNPDLTLVRNEFLTNPLYSGRLVSSDFKTTAIILNLHKDRKYDLILEERNALLLKQRSKTISNEELQQLADVKVKFKQHRDLQRNILSKDIAKIRKEIWKLNSTGKLFLGGVSMIANDIVSYVRNDLFIYGISLIVLLIIILSLLFKKPKWVIVPLTICVLAVVAITSTLGLFGWEITVISSNFIALQLIITISIVLHLIVRYEELLSLYPNASNKRIVLLATMSKLSPTAFAILTTIAGFSSLMLSKIYPVINLAWMMSSGILFSLIISFLFFPLLTSMFPKGKHRSVESQSKFLNLIINIIRKDRFVIYLLVISAISFSITGASKLIVENSFIDYFKKDTQIYQSMKVIDRDLGGTTPLDIIITFKNDEEASVDLALSDIEDSEEDEFGEEFEEIVDEEQYWFTEQKIELVKKVHNYLDSLPQIGNIQSLATLLEVGKVLNHNEDLDIIKLSLLYQTIPQEYKDAVLAPYLNIKTNQIRFSTRIVDSQENLRRDALLKQIKTEISSIVNPKIADVNLSNLMVLYNNLLQSLFDSQIATLGMVLAILGVMFLILYRSIILTLIALTVNIIPIGLVFGSMGWLSIPLDVMTITIAAIAIGIGVDDTIHYLHRFKDELRKHGHSYIDVAQKTNSSVGSAMVFTSLSIIIGFSIFVLSNLIPTIYFAILTILAMSTALMSNLVLLPKLLILFKPIKG